MIGELALKWIENVLIVIGETYFDPSYFIWEVQESNSIIIMGKKFMVVINRGRLYKIYQ